MFFLKVTVSGVRDKDIADCVWCRYNFSFVTHLFLVELAKTAC